jgi:hypothetical protein
VLLPRRAGLRGEIAVPAGGVPDHGVSLSLYAKDPDGLEFEVFWTVPGGRSVPTRPLDLDGELARRGIRMP